MQSFLPPSNPLVHAQKDVSIFWWKFEPPYILVFKSWFMSGSLKGWSFKSIAFLFVNCLKNSQKIPYLCIVFVGFVASQKWISQIRCFQNHSWKWSWVKNFEIYGYTLSYGAHMHISLNYHSLSGLKVISSNHLESICLVLVQCNVSLAAAMLCHYLRKCNAFFICGSFGLFL